MRTCIVVAAMMVVELTSGVLDTRGIGSFSRAWAQPDAPPPAKTAAPLSMRSQEQPLSDPSEWNYQDFFATSDALSERDHSRDRSDNDAAGNGDDDDFAGLGDLDTIVQGHIVHIEDREIYFDIGAVSGIGTGMRVRIKRPLRLRHPVNGQQIDGWLPIGAADVGAIANRLSMARLVSDQVLAAVKLGDIVECYIEKPLSAPSSPTPPPIVDTSHIRADIAPETAAALAVFQRVAGSPLAGQIEAWRQFLDLHSDVAYAAEVREDLRLLRSYRERIAPPELELSAAPAPTAVAIEHSPPRRAAADRNLDLVFIIAYPTNFITAWLHYRPSGAPSFRKVPVFRQNEIYLHGMIPAAQVHQTHARTLEYFVEVVDASGTAFSAVGSPSAPIRVSLVSPAGIKTEIAARKQRRKGRSRVSVRTSYLDFATFDRREGRREDSFITFEADFLYRLRGSFLYGIRNGMGVINGRGGFADPIPNDESGDGSSDDDASKTGFHYGYSEVEFRLGAYFGLRARLVAGVGRRGFGLGIDGRVRLGPESGTNLSLGAQALEQVGFLSEIRMQWLAIAKLPLGLAVALTDQPNQGDVGVRLSTDIGYPVLPWLRPTLRVSYQARTIAHSGLGAGVGMVFDW